MADTPPKSNGDRANGTPQRSEPEGPIASLVESLRQELDQVRRELAEVKAERDEFKHYLYKLAEKRIEFDEEELLASVAPQKSFRELLDEISKSPER